MKRVKRPPDPPISDRTFRAAVLFARLANSLARGKLTDAASAQVALARLGFTVQVGATSDCPETGRPVPFKDGTKAATDLAIGLFVRLADSLDLGKLTNATSAQAKLARLGFVIQVGATSDCPEAGRPRLRPYAPRQQAEGRGAR